MTALDELLARIDTVLVECDASQLERAGAADAAASAAPAVVTATTEPPGTQHGDNAPSVVRDGNTGTPRWPRLARILRRPR